MIKIKELLRSFGISLTAAVCIIIGIGGIAASYENTRRIGLETIQKRLK
ncbi:MAG: hypothetical protein ACLR56_05125 [Oscillospiraceae bacterium]